jgi:hypothetical protein
MIIQLVFVDSVPGMMIAVTGVNIKAAAFVVDGSGSAHLVLGLSDGCIELHTVKGRWLGCSRLLNVSQAA